VNKEIVKKRISGSLKAPASKSVAQRALAIATLAKGTTRIFSAGSSDDVLSALRVCKVLGAEISTDKNSLIIRGGLTNQPKLLDCGESGLGIRMFSAVAATLSECITLTGSGSLASRPMDMIEKSLVAAGAECTTSGGLLPIKVKGPLTGGDAMIDGSVSSQVLTGLLIAAPYAKAPVVFHVNDLKSRPYVDITTKIMEDFGVKVENDDYKSFSINAPQEYLSREYTIEGDWSGAAFLLVAGALGGEVVVENLDSESPQADSAILKALYDCGAHIVAGKDSVQVKKTQLKAFTMDATHCPDLFPPLVVLAAGCHGMSTIKGVSRLRVKESDRAQVLKTEFGKLGLDIRTEGDYMYVWGKTLTGGTIHSHHDHRIAMAGAVASIISDNPVVIEEAQAVSKSYPDFFDDLAKISIKL
jgi:3-phosphoshikimate 1-carboxyvinyltransferase